MSSDTLPGSAPPVSAAAPSASAPATAREDFALWRTNHELRLATLRGAAVGFAAALVVAVACSAQRTSSHTGECGRPVIIVVPLVPPVPVEAEPEPDIVPIRHEANSHAGSVSRAALRPCLGSDVAALGRTSTTRERP
jgi:hypothetical protein